MEQSADGSGQLMELTAGGAVGSDRCRLPRNPATGGKHAAGSSRELGDSEGASRGSSSTVGTQHDSHSSYSTTFLLP